MAVVGQAGEPGRIGWEGVGDQDPCGVEAGADLLVLGGFGVVLADPLGGVFERVAVSQAGRQPFGGGLVIVEFG